MRPPACPRRPPAARPPPARRPSPFARPPARPPPTLPLPPSRFQGHFSKFQLETLFYIFYNMPRDTLQAYAATELYNRDWRYHKDLKLWFTRASQQKEQQKGQYIYFDINEWKKKVFHGAGGGGAGGGADGADGALPTDGGDGAGLPTDPALGL